MAENGKNGNGENGNKYCRNGNRFKRNGFSKTIVTTETELTNKEVIDVMMNVRAHKLDSYGLTRRERSFCDEYLIDLRPKDSALRAGYKPKHASQIANNLLNKPKIMKYIAKRRKKLMEARKSTPEDVVAGVMDIADANIKDYLIYGENGIPYYIPSWQLTRRQAAAIKSVKIYVDGSIKLELHDKLSAKDMLMRYHGLFVDKHKHELGWDPAGPAPELHVHIGEQPSGPPVIDITPEA